MMLPHAALSDAPTCGNLARCVAPLQLAQVASKPFLVESNGFWSITVPPKLSGTRGVAPADGGPSISLQDAYIAREGDTAATINAGIASKAALLLTPAIYALSEPIVIAKTGFVVSEAQREGRGAGWGEVACTRSLGRFGAMSHPGRLYRPPVPTQVAHVEI